MPLSLIFIQPGAYTIEDDGILGNNTSVIRDGTGAVIFTFAHPADALTFTVSTPGVTLTLNMQDPMTCDVTFGNLANAPECPDAIAVRNLNTSGDVILAATGAITEAGSDAAPDIVAATLVLSAGTGVGAGNAIETRTGILEAETTTGGIAVANQGSLSIGGLSADVAGLHVVTSGDINVSTTGTLTLNDDTGFETVRGGSTSGAVVLTATGANSDIFSIIDQDSISAPGGSITLNAGRDIAFGTSGVNFDNDVRARGAVTFNAGRDVVLDGFADIGSDDFGASTGGHLTVNAGRNITVSSLNGTDGSFFASGSAGADLFLNTGEGGILTLSASSSAVAGSSSGDVLVRADHVNIAATAGISASAGSVTLRTATLGREIDLGTALTLAHALGLSDAELDRVFTSNLIIGDASTDTVTVSAAITPGAQHLTVNSGGNIVANGGVTVAGNLVMNAADNFLVGAGATLTGASVAAAVDAPSTDAGVGGIFTLAGSIVGGSNVFGNADADTMNGNAAANTFNGGGGNDTLRGFDGADILRGQDGADVLDGGVGADRLDGGTGVDSMTGGADNDTYVVDAAGDQTVELVAGGTDTVETALGSWVLAANVEHLTYTGAAAFFGTGNALGNTFRGGAAKDTFLGHDGNDIMLAGAGVANELYGGLGDDYFILQGVDTVVELAGQGTDTIEARVNGYVLGANIENLLFGGVGNFTGTGNAQSNLIIGGAGDDTLRGGGGTDQIQGGLGSDTLLLQGTSGQYTITPEGGGFRIVDSVAGRDGSILATGIETIQYGNGATQPLPAPLLPPDKGGGPLVRPAEPDAEAPLVLPALADKGEGPEPLVLPGLEADAFVLKAGDLEPLVLPWADPGPSGPPEDGPAPVVRLEFLDLTEAGIGAVAPDEQRHGDWLF